MVMVIFIILMLESDFFDVFAYLIYAAVIVLLIATIFLAPDIKGSHSWLKLGALRIQPAEFAKFATALAVAKFMNSYGFQLTTVKNFAITLMLIFLPTGYIPTFLPGTTSGKKQNKPKPNRSPFAG